MKKQFLEIGKIVATQGLKGEVRVEPWCDDAEFLCSFETLYFDKGNIPVTVEKGRIHKTLAIIKLENVKTVEDAQKLRGKILYMDRNDVELDENSYFVQDLIGLSVINTDTGEEYGELVDVSETGANDVYHIKCGEVTYLIPAIPDVIIETDITNGKMLIRPMKGLFDDED